MDLCWCNTIWMKCVCFYHSLIFFLFLSVIHLLDRCRPFQSLQYHRITIHRKRWLYTYNIDELPNEIVHCRHRFESNWRYLLPTKILARKLFLPWFLLIFWSTKLWATVFIASIQPILLKPIKNFFPRGVAIFLAFALFSHHIHAIYEISWSMGTCETNISPRIFRVVVLHSKAGPSI